MQPNRDFRDLFAALNGAGAEYLVVGAHALAAHGHVRATKDIDVWIRADPENAVKVTIVSGLTFAEAWPARVKSRYGDQPIAVLSREHLIQNKLASGRLQDLADV